MITLTGIIQNRAARRTQRRDDAIRQFIARTRLEALPVRTWCPPELNCRSCAAARTAR